jgi:hypothetical protein
MRSEVLTAVKILMLFFWVVMPCGLITSVLEKHSISMFITEAALKMEMYISLKCWLLPTNSHGIITEKNNIHKIN